MQGHLALQAYNESKAKPIESTLVNQWGDPLASVKPELVSQPLTLKELADEKTRPVFGLKNRKRAEQFLKVNKTTKMKIYGTKNRGK